MATNNVSADLVWELVRSNNSYLVKRKESGGIQFSRDPLNLTNVHSRKHAGFVNTKAIGVQPAEKNGVKVISKKESAVQKPAKSTTEVTHSGGKATRKIYKTVANQTAKSGYRPDLREAAVSRVSAIRQSQREPKPTPEKKPRGAKAKKAAAAES
ncbi:ribosomal L28e protein family-domain-containing protein [Daldinia loculata]|uniref:ribosomal L28e protein family-domain-containing protein n=1 Tax=Daldinia loculata TaxID=103429 RepID=UPI0020C1ED76|nr:ribosomal L28e protein family-domain-containing protein [Daldinia loculata]KAI1646334.1 ribosomal L28e protein family-domain-containing protein [Daldinia loculata]